MGTVANHYESNIQELLMSYTSTMMKNGEGSQKLQERYVGTMDQLWP